MNFKNWGRQYKYVLKANYIDLTHARNVVSAKLWGKCVKTRSNFDSLPEQLRTSPNLGAIDGFFIKVYYDGISNLVVYDEALSGGQISNILNNIALSMTIRSNYSPNGASFSNNFVANFNIEELYVTVDLSTCAGTNECILSFGNAINEWTNAYCIHFYYTESTDSMVIENGHIRLTQTISGTMTIIFNSDGLRVNGTLYSPTDYLTFSNIGGLGTVIVGSTQGDSRSHASNYNIGIRPKTTV